MFRSAYAFLGQCSPRNSLTLVCLAQWLAAAAASDIPVTEVCSSSSAPCGQVRPIQVRHFSSSDQQMAPLVMANSQLFDDIKAFKQVKIRDEDKVKTILQTMLGGGNEQLQFIVDFDNTLSRVHRDGKPLSCSWGVFETSKFVSKDYLEKSDKLRKKYLPIELDAHMSIEEKTPHIIQWYKEANRLLVSGEVGTVHKNTFSQMVKESNVELREGTQALMEDCFKRKVPVLVLSAGLGDMVSHILMGLDAMHPNMHVVSNFLDYDSEGNIVGIKNGDEGIIHVYNKNEKSLEKMDNDNFVASLAARRNVVVLGDSLGDCGMANGVENPSAVLKVGFLNHDIESEADQVRLNKYMDAFDIVLVDDMTMDVMDLIAKAVDQQSA